MKELKIVFGNTDDVYDFVEAVNLFGAPMEIVQGRYRVNAKSIMGIFSLDITHESTLNIISDDTDEIEKSIERFIVK